MVNITYTYDLILFTYNLNVAIVGTFATCFLPSRKYFEKSKFPILTLRRFSLSVINDYVRFS